MWLLPDWIKAIWEVISKISKLIWVLITNAWKPLLGVSSLLALLWQKVKEVVGIIVDSVSGIWATISGAGSDAKTMMAAGWPPWMADAFAFGNGFFPVAETMLYFGIIISTFLVMTLVRIVKSFLPAVAT